MTEPTPHIVIDSSNTDDKPEEKKVRHSKEKKHKGTGAKIKSFFSKIKVTIIYNSSVNHSMKKSIH
jgi:hypothetical protein